MRPADAIKVGGAREGQRRRPGSTTQARVGIVCIAVATGGLAYEVSPALLLAVIGVIGLAASALPGGGYAIFVVGGLALLDTTSELSLPKMAWFAALAVGSVAAQMRLFQYRREPWIRWTLTLSYLVVAWLLGPMLLQGLLGRTDMSLWLRDAFTQLLIPVGVIVGLDAGLRFGTAWLIKFTAVVGAVAAVQFAITWVSRRTAAEGSEVLLFGSRALLAVPFVLGVAFGATTGRRLIWRWLVYAYAIISLGVISGVRSSLTLLAGVAGVVGRRSRGSVSTVRALTFLVSGVVAVIGVVAIVAPFLGGTEFVQTRLLSLVNLWAAGDLNADASARSRLAISSEMLKVFGENPLIGTGLGTIQAVDSPFVYLAKYGLFGSMLFVGSLTGIIALLIRAGSSDPRVRNLVRGSATIWFFSCLSAAPTEDKGFSIALALCVALVASVAGRQVLTTPPSGTRG